MQIRAIREIRGKLLPFLTTDYLLPTTCYRLLATDYSPRVVRSIREIRGKLLLFAKLETRNSKLISSRRLSPRRHCLFFLIVNFKNRQELCDLQQVLDALVQPR
ncbi:MAG: hypothetical protein JWO20_808 [Candidatus Angelobacter sp.]|nr:hypothetical protein [Candidatus Angelobacter sp.]